MIGETVAPVKFIKPRDAEYIIQKLASSMVSPVNLVLFSQQYECTFCLQTHGLLEELKELSNLINLEVYDFAADHYKVREYNIDKIPALAVTGEKDYGIRYYGVPAGFEFASLLDDVIEVSTQKPKITDLAVSRLKLLDKPIHIQVFVSPTCPYCPVAVKLAHSFAIESDLIRADMVEISEFTQLALKYNVYSVPKIIINEKIEIEGAVPEQIFIDKILEA